VRHVEFGAVLGEQGQEMDQGLAWAFRAPNSFTGEDTVEISCHGSLLVLEAVVRAAVFHGAVLAQPGEFTRRAFLNGKIDLIQAEAVVDLIRAAGQVSLDNAYGLLNGRLSAQITQIRQTILRALAHAEALLDFAEDVAIDPEGIAVPMAEALGICARLTSTFSTFSRGSDGFSVAIIGPPNAGKSSLFNLLLQESRAIVSPFPGTTRDLIESRLYIGGDLFRIADSAGLHPTDNPIEEEGIRRAYGAAENADLILLVLDSSLPWAAEYAGLLRVLDPRRDLVVLNKSDLPRQLCLVEEGSRRSVSLSTLSGAGVPALLDHLKSAHPAGAKTQAVGLTRLRHYEGLCRVQAHLEAALVKTKESAFAVECVAEDLHGALVEISTLLGVEVCDEVLDLIFSEFCIGK
jgi:tRNA modification GTPase